MIHVNMGGYRTPTPPADETGDRPMPADDLTATERATLPLQQDALQLINDAYERGVAAGRKQALREASGKIGDLLASWPAVPTFAAVGIEHRFAEWAARIAEGGGE